ncbi:SPOSA6832_01303 [Sporobolomyces salmonicolor]|uniref:SPOSA6832_01303-mRNA-1:cds n=1 Tax=Sporidiobolus salmonicolor TaxID=5005 RepID=A0A0D6EIA7_SPOSA|nr:SPOSA6832_01303 [Sporobolomyces salmonicolor]
MQPETARDPAESARPNSPPPSELSEWIYANRNTIAALNASFCSTIAGSRLQVKRYSSVLDCARRTYAEEGIRGFFRGVTIPLVTITLVRTASFSIYTYTKEQLARRDLLRGDSIASTAGAGVLGGAASGLLLSIGTTAFEYTKKGVPYEPRGTIQGFLDLYRAGGFRGLYTGFRLHAMRDTLGTGFYFGFYDCAQYTIANNPEVFERVPNFVSTFACGSAAGLASWGLIYPLDLVKAKVQRNALADAPYEKPLHIFKRLSAGGIPKLYRGLGRMHTRNYVASIQLVSKIIRPPS